MYNNYWVAKSLEIIENERVVLKQTSDAGTWYNRMPKIIPAICPEVSQLKTLEDYGPKVGYIHYIRFTKFGIEAVLKAPRKYHRYNSYVLFNANIKPSEPFWLVLHK